MSPVSGPCGHGKPVFLGNCGVVRRVEPGAKFFNDFSRACMRVRAKGVSSAGPGIAERAGPL
jgi:hypothetical protein